MKKFTSLVLLTFTLFLFSVQTALAQSTESTQTTELDAMSRLDFMLGTWEGEGWIMRGPGARHTFKGSETVTSMLGGMIMTVEGVHRAEDPDSGEEMVIHHAFGVFSYVLDDDMYRFQTHLSDGRAGEYEAHMDGDNLIWGMEHPQAGLTRYTIGLNESGEWHEIGESSRDGGENWFQFFEMTLHRTDAMSGGK